MLEKEAVIVSCVRTAIGKQGGALASMPAHLYGAEVIKEAIKRASITADMQRIVLWAMC